MKFTQARIYEEENDYGVDEKKEAFVRIGNFLYFEFNIVRLREGFNKTPWMLIMHESPDESIWEGKHFSVDTESEAMQKANEIWEEKKATLLEFLNNN